MFSLNFDFTQLTAEAARAAERPKQLRRLIWTRVRITSFTAERFIKIRMPVDTGRARASWGHSTAPANANEGIWRENQEELSIEQGSTVDYIAALNEGSSMQAPAGFIDAEVERAVNEFKKGLESDLEKLA